MTPERSSLGDAVHKALNDDIKRIVDEEAVEASKRVEKRVKERTAEIAALVLNKFDMTWRGDVLTIRVEFPKV